MMKIIVSCSPTHLFKWCFDGGLSIMLWWRLHIEISQLVKIHQNDQDMRRHFFNFYYHLSVASLPESVQHIVCTQLYIQHS